jgi:hypothetical protein
VCKSELEPDQMLVYCSALCVSLLQCEFDCVACLCIWNTCAQNWKCPSENKDGGVNPGQG